MVHAGFHHLGVLSAEIQLWGGGRVVGAHVYLNGRMKKKKKKFQTLDRDGGFDARASQMRPHLGFSGQPLAGALSTPLPNADQPLPAWDPSVLFSVL